MDNKTIHIVEIISNRLKEEGRTKKWLAERVNCEQSSFCKALKKKSVNSDLLLQISTEMQHDFFKYFSDCYAEIGNMKK